MLEIYVARLEKARPPPSGAALWQRPRAQQKVPHGLLCAETKGVIFWQENKPLENTTRGVFSCSFLGLFPRPLRPRQGRCMSERARARPAGSPGPGPLEACGPRSPRSRRAAARERRRRGPGPSSVRSNDQGRGSDHGRQAARPPGPGASGGPVAVVGTGARRLRSFVGGAPGVAAAAGRALPPPASRPGPPRGRTSPCGGEIMRSIRGAITAPRQLPAHSNQRGAGSGAPATCGSAAPGAHRCPGPGAPARRGLAPSVPPC